jgi:hypothetical protein
MRAELRSRLDRRREVAGITANARDELVDEAIGFVVMSSKPIRDEQHLQGAFWASIGFLLAEYRAGRRDLHVGSRRRVDFEPVSEVLPDDEDEPFDVVAARERIATAADLMAQLDPFEQRVFAAMAVHGLGVKRVAKALGEPIKTVLAAARSAERKLDQVAAITAAGRMCDYRGQAIHAHAEGTAQAEQERAARAHLAACASCRSSYEALLREISGREFKRAASAAFLPPPVLLDVHGGWIERLTSLSATGRAPGGAAAERTAGVLGGGGLVKAAAATSALVIAGAGVGAKVVRSLEAPASVHRHHHRSGVRAHPAVSTVAPSVEPRSAVGNSTSVHTTATRRLTPPRLVAKHHRAAPPSRDLGYLALGRSSSNTPRPQALVATAASASPNRSVNEASEPPRSGGGTSLDYLGR